MRRLPVLCAGSAVVVLLLYVLAGELLQMWVGLHLNAWAERAAFSREQDRAEWQRVRDTLQVATGLWPWKTSLLLDSARTELFGYYAWLESPEQAGSRVLAAMTKAKSQRVEDGEMLVLTLRGHVLSNDVDGARAAMMRLQKAAPHARAYWQPTVVFLCEDAMNEPDFQPLAREAVAYYIQWDEAALRGMAQRSVAIKMFLPVSGSAVPAAKTSAGKP